MIKVLFLTRSTIYSVRGGDTVQMELTATYLRKLNVLVDIHVDSSPINYKKYDLIHFFNIIRPADILFHTQQTNIPFVISSIYVDYREYERNAAPTVRRIIARVCSPDLLEYLKVIARKLTNNEPIRSTYYLRNGHRKSIIKLMHQAAMLLPNSQHEYDRLMKDYNVKNIPYIIVPNGIDSALFSKQLSSTQKREGVLCVARIEGRKNQLNLIKALDKKNIHFTLIGKPAPNHMAYFEECKKAAGENVTFIDFVSLEDLLTYYQKTKVHVLPSWLETTGLASLEAAAMGCNVVITAKGDTEEYFENDAEYCEPDNIDSIYNAIMRAYEKPFNENLRDRILEKYTWEKAAEQTLLAYKKVLNK